MNCSQCPVWEKSLFSDLPESALRELENHKTTVQAAKGDSFSMQGAPVENVYCVRSGAVKIVKRTQQNESIVRFIVKGDMVGYRCLFSEDRFKATSVALGPVTACKMSKETIFNLSQKHFTFARKIMQWLGEDIAAAEESSHAFCLKSSRERTAEFLLILKSKCGQSTPAGEELQIPVTRHDLANWIGVAKETLIRCLSDFREEGLIDQNEDFIIIRDSEGLRKVAALS